MAGDETSKDRQPRPRPRPHTNAALGAAPEATPPITPTASEDSGSNASGSPKAGERNSGNGAAQGNKRSASTAYLKGPGRKDENDDEGTSHTSPPPSPPPPCQPPSSDEPFELLATIDMPADASAEPGQVSHARAGAPNCGPGVESVAPMAGLEPNANGLLGAIENHLPYILDQLRGVLPDPLQPDELGLLSSQASNRTSLFRDLTRTEIGTPCSGGAERGGAAQGEGDVGFGVPALEDSEVFGWDEVAAMHLEFHQWLQVPPRDDAARGGKDKTRFSGLVMNLDHSCGG
ncbi:hypothetical protein MKZ38_010007 [Zalerion maritima]|uniref:Uncharacterized protein n=1 Tax=Zalerion maritima TaxID=339359 RepID=A0AAD5RFN9_9PEZI|nr:hypothetical protein MKZ38_010007 [Zalerion maritima]